MKRNKAEQFEDMIRLDQEISLSLQTINDLKVRHY